MSLKRKAQGGLLMFIGFMLSPLSWWNDAFVNLPLAIGFAWIVARFYRPAFEPATIIGYWLTNLLGLLLMHFGARKITAGQESKFYARRDFLRDLVISLLYTGLIALLLRFKILRPL